MDKLKIAVVGSGRWGKNLLRVLGRIEGVEVAAVCDADLNALVTTIFREPDNRLFTSFDKMLAEADADAVVIATPPRMHYQMAARALEAGKHVFVEKPMTLGTIQADALKPRIADRTFMVGHTFLYNDLVREMERLIIGGNIGEILYARGAWLNWGTVRSDVDAFQNFAPHPISILLHLFGFPPQAAYVMGSSYLQPGVDDVSLVVLKFGKAVASLAVSWLSPTKVRQLMVVGEKATIIFDDMAKELRIVEGDSTRCAAFGTFGEFQLLRDAGRTVIPRVEYREPLLNEMEHFVECCRTGAEPLTGFAHGAEVVRILESAERL